MVAMLMAASLILAAGCSGSSSSSGSSGAGVSGSAE
jgi:hypothetical protein